MKGRGEGGGFGEKGIEVKTKTLTPLYAHRFSILGDRHMIFCPPLPHTIQGKKGGKRGRKERIEQGQERCGHRKRGRGREEMREKEGKRGWDSKRGRGGEEMRENEERGGDSKRGGKGGRARALALMHNWMLSCPSNRI
jgi:hypothetical protein